MKIQELLSNHQKLPADYVHAIRNTCGDFIYSTESPLIKNLNMDSLVSRVKIRHHKRNDPFVEVFNDALLKKFGKTNIHQRCIFANGPDSFKKVHNQTPYYVFPIDGFSFLYSRQITDVNEEFRDTLSVLKNSIDSSEAFSIVHDLLLYTYESSNLEQGIIDGCEIIVYDIPYYFAVNVKSFPVYDQLLHNIRGHVL